MREMKDSGVSWMGQIPKNWGICRFKHTHNGTNVGEGIDKDYWSDNNQDSLFYTAGAVPIHTNYLEFPSWKYTNPGDLLLARNGTPYVYLPDEGALYTDHIIRAKIKDGFNRRFVRYSIMQSIKAEVVDTVSITTWSAAIWNEQSLPFPSLKEQNRIADFLDSKCSNINNIIENTKSSIEEYKKLKQSVITEAVTKGIRGERPMKDSGIEWIGEIPQNWSSIKLKYCSYIRARLGWKGLKADEYVEQGYPLLSAFNIINNKLDFTEVNFINQFRYDESPEIKLSLQDILLVKDGAGIGKCAIVEELPYESTPNGSLAVITVQRHLKAKYLYYYFLSNMFQKMIDQLKDGMGVPHLFQSDMREIEVVFGSEEEQKEIISYLDQKCSEIDTLIESKEKFIKELEAYKKSLIYEYVTGKKEVPNAL